MLYYFDFKKITPYKFELVQIRIDRKDFTSLLTKGDPQIAQANMLILDLENTKEYWIAISPTYSCWKDGTSAYRDHKVYTNPIGHSIHEVFHLKFEDGKWSTSQ